MRPDVLRQQPNTELVRCSTEIVERLVHEESEPVVVVSIERHDDGTAELTFRTSEVAFERDRLRARVEELEQGMAAEARIVEAQTLDVKALGKGRREILLTQVKRMRECALGGPARSYVKYHARDWRALLQRDIGARP